jgi:hypothetical protein
METIKVMSSVINVKSDVEQNHLVHLGCQRFTPQVLTAQSFQVSPSQPVQTSFVYNPPSLQSIVDRQMYVRAYIDITTDQPMVLGVEDCLRQFPLSSIVEVSTISINGESVSDNTQSKLHALLTYGNTPADRDRSSSVSPCQPDQYQQYSSWTTLGSARNVACFYGENSAEQSRGGFPVEVISPTRIRAVVCEPIFVSPMVQGLSGTAQEGMVNVNEFTLNLRHSSNVGRVLSHSTNGNAITAVSVSFYQAPELLISVYTPDLLQRIPELQILSYSKPNEYIRQMSPILAGASQNVFSDTIRLSQIPRYIYLFARRSDATSTFATADSFCSIENISVQWGNDSGLLSSATKQQLYEINRRSGSNLSWAQWSQYRGSVLALELGRDIGLQSFEAPGVNGAYTIQVQVNFKNQSNSTFTGQFYLVTLNQGTFSISPNTARSSLGGLTPEQVLASRNSPEMTRDNYEGLHGGSFWSSLKNIVNKVATAVAPALTAYNPALGSIATGVAGLTSGSGMGMNQAVMSALPSGGRRVGGMMDSGRVRRR